MSNWQQLIEARDWDAFEHWWWEESDRNKRVAAWDELKRQCPKTTRVNGMESFQDFVKPDEAPEGWRGLAILIELGELQASLDGNPPRASEDWAALRSRTTEILSELAKQPELTEGDDVLSRVAHIAAAHEWLDEIKKESNLALQQADTEDQDWLRELVSAVARSAFLAGAHASAAAGKEVEWHALRGKNMIESGKRSWDERRPESMERNRKIVSCMKKVMADNPNLSIAAASRIAHEKYKLGASPEANRQVYYRWTPNQKS